MLALNSAFVDNAQALAAQLESPPTLAAAQAHSSGFPRFSDLLERAQSERAQSEPAEAPQEGSASALAGGNAQPNTNSSGRSRGNNSAPPPEPRQQATPASTATTATPAHEEIDHSSRQSGSASHHRDSPDGVHGAVSSKAKGSASPQPAVATAVTNGKALEKPKQQQSGTGGEVAQVTPTGSSATAAGSNAAPADPAAVASNPNIAAAIAAALDNVEPNAALTPKARNSKASDSDSALAFAVKIQGTGSTGAGSLLAQTIAAAAAEPANADAQTAASPFAAELTAMLPVSAARPGLKELRLKELSLKELGLQAAGGGVSASASELAAAASAGSYSTAAGAAVNTARDAPAAEETAPLLAVPDELAAGSQPVKTVQIQITGADDQRVDLKLMEKSGALSMSVRSSDGALTQALQQNLPDLASRLNDQQIQAEWWRPDIRQTEASPQSPDSSGGGGSNNAASQDRGHQNSGNQNQRNSGQPQPDWLEELAAPNQSNQNGTQFSWQL